MNHLYRHFVLETHISFETNNLDDVVILYYQETN